jgi:glyoxylase-like metal-dependent hydrolase (beta-lactamase superfamily II)
MTEAQVSSFSVGAIRVEVIRDTTGRGSPADFFVGQPESAWREFVTLDDEGLLQIPIQCLLVRVGERIALLDTGIGLDERSPEMAGVYGEHGRLIPELARLGVTPDQIDVVVLSHGHADHLGGTVNPAVQRPSFPRARYLIGAADYRYFTSSEERATWAFCADQLATLEQHGQLEPIDGELEVLPGVRLLPAPGHTPGHACAGLTSGNEHALYIGDLIHQTAQVVHPEWYPIWDWMPHMAMQSRRRVLDQARRDGSLVLSAHLPSPGVGHISDRWLPLAGD